MSLIEKLTPEQEALIVVYREKWRKIALSNERIDREKAAEAVKAAYKTIGFEEPKIIFCDSPDVVCENYLKFGQFTLIFEESGRVFICEVSKQLQEKLSDEAHDFLYSKKYYKQFYALCCKFPYIPIVDNWYDQIYDQLSIKWRKNLNENLLYYTLNIEEFADLACSLDIYFSILDFSYIEDKYKIVQSIIKECGIIFTFEKIAIICDRPIHLRFDNENRLHAEGEPAIEYADGYSLYSYHGVTLPEKYGKIHPQEWQAQWLLTETNAELRRVLIQGIGYSRICQDLQAIELDNWAGYTLLRIDNDFIDIEPILLLKMTCPSTGFIHVLRVPPNMVSARDAIRWINWGLEPDDFIIET
ncbi:hypothetical protein NIES21_55490 [Anabaenopsis circularis NIES-21]|uniref:DUF6745 domain-containing protein n=1 Tax=Anabaenopsis circularis NIES-21 TaxID=1085406 RepID=A0A1Z4GQA8_9CYAN|nr:hypothetical protein NIES21_55490 [Anabaenopsis circularis NIES-21]